MAAPRREAIRRLSVFRRIVRTTGVQCTFGFLAFACIPFLRQLCAYYLPLNGMLGELAEPLIVNFQIHCCILCFLLLSLI